MSKLSPVALALGLAALAGCGLPGGAVAPRQFDNAYFYDAAGKFRPERAKDAYIALMRHHGYPVYRDMREQLWVSDYGTGQFAKLGLGARMWVNNTEHHYMLLDLFLLPGQMLPEHWHEKPERLPQKMEGWLVRHGSAYIVGEGEANLAPSIAIPKVHMGGTTLTKHAVLARAGDFVRLNRPGARHWQLAGHYGAIISEVANVHANEAVRHSDPKINDHFLGK